MALALNRLITTRRMIGGSASTFSSGARPRRGRQILSSECSLKTNDKKRRKPTSLSRQSGPYTSRSLISYLKTLRIAISIEIGARNG